MVRTRGYFWRLFVGHVALVALVLGVSLALMLAAYQRDHRRRVEQQVRMHARTALQLWPRVVASPEGSAEGRQLAQDAAAAVDPELRYTLVAADGRLLADSLEDGGRDADPTEPEMAAALRDGEGFSVRWSHSLARQCVFAAVRVGSAQRPEGVVRAGLPAAALEPADGGLPRTFTQIMLVCFAAATVLAMILARAWSHPLGVLLRLARREEASAAGHRTGLEELDAVASSLRQLREDLSEQHAVRDGQQRTTDELLSRLRDGVLVADEDGRIVLINPAAISLLDLSADPETASRRFTGMPIEACVPLFELQGMLRVAQGPPADGGAGTATPGVPEQRVEIRRRGGSVFLLARSSPIRLPERDDSGRSAEGRLLVLTDVTELSRVVQVKSDLVANASHELRTPIAAIRMASETMRGLDPTEDAATMRRCLDIIDRHTGWLEELVRDLLDLAKLESPYARFQPQIVDVPAFSAELRERFTLAVEKKQIDLAIDVQGAPPRLMANPGLLRMVLDNLVDNAVKFTDRGGQVRLTWRSAGQDVQIEVADTGCGIPIEDQARVFERFYQVERARSGAEAAAQDQPRGTGLGLAIVRHAVMAMRGRLELESTLGKGTRITVTLPKAVATTTGESPA